MNALLLALADDKLLLGHRNSDWTGLGPMLEEDIAFSSLAQDEIAHASALYDLLAPRLGRSADAIAFGRDPEAYRCAAIVTMPDEFDWANAIARQLYCDHFDAIRLERLGRSGDAEVAALARRLAAEERLHVDHADDWLRRLGRGTDESRRRLQGALDALAAPAAMLFEPVEGEPELVAEGFYPLPEAGDPFELWSAALAAAAEAGGLEVKVSRPDPAAVGGRRGHPGEHLAPLLEEMTEVYRLEPGAAW